MLAADASRLSLRLFEIMSMTRDQSKTGGLDSTNELLAGWDLNEPESIESSCTRGERRGSPSEPKGADASSRPVFVGLGLSRRFRGLRESCAPSGLALRFEPGTDDSVDMHQGFTADQASFRAATKPVSVWPSASVDSKSASASDETVSLRTSPSGERIEAVSPTSRPVMLPRAGDEVGDFRLVSELGRGAFARVFLAEQKSLAGRLVALKVSRAEGDEPQLLARLQHTHIVPIHSVFDDPATGLRLMCMPYLGGANLSQVLDRAVSRGSTRATGRELVDALDLVSRREGVESISGTRAAFASALSRSRFAREFGDASFRGSRSIPPALSGPRMRSLWARVAGRPGNAASAEIDPHAPSARSACASADDVAAAETVTTHEEFGHPARQFLRDADCTRAAVWIVARLAEGLEHAHSRGLLHRDLKPSNILIAGDGTPMLLDFNLAADRSVGDLEEGRKAHLGGTLPYMAPEHLQAFLTPSAEVVNEIAEQADIYALGLILFEIVAGRHAFPESTSQRPLLEVIRSMAAERAQAAPSLREACPGVSHELDAIVRKALAPDPAKRYTLARELAEDLQAHLDDLPLPHVAEPSLRERIAKWARRNPRLCGSSTMAMLALTLVLMLGGVMGLMSTNLQGVSARLRYRAFASSFDECQFLLNTLGAPDEHLKRGIKAADETLAQQGVDLKKPIATQLSWISLLRPEEQASWRRRISELILLEARARTLLATRIGTEADRRAALEWSVLALTRAEKIDSAPAGALYEDRARYYDALGLAEQARRDQLRGESLPPQDGRDFYLLGAALLRRGEFARSEEALRRSVELDPRAFWSWFALGHCHFEEGKFLEAAGDFAASIALQPDFAWPHLNRGLAFARAGYLHKAMSEYNLALSASPNFAEALVDRALVELELGDAPAAERDLRAAVALGRKEPSIHAALAETLSRLGRRDEAEKLFDSFLADDPRNTLLRVARGFFYIESDKVRARHDFEHVLELNGNNPRALLGLALIERADNPRSALRRLDQALNADPTLLDAVQLRALALAKLGDPAALDDVDRLAATPTPPRLYNAACAVALLVQTTHEPRLAHHALELLRKAIDAGFDPARAARDPDFKALRDQKDFQELIAKHDRTKKA